MAHEHEGNLDVRVLALDLKHSLDQLVVEILVCFGVQPLLLSGRKFAGSPLNAVGR